MDAVPGDWISAIPTGMTNAAGKIIFNGLAPLKLPALPEPGLFSFFSEQNLSN
jgi:hypothetical protein